MDRFKTLTAIGDFLLDLREAMLDAERQAGPTLCEVPDQNLPSARNLIHYLALRRTDLGAIEPLLARCGLSSLQRCEAAVLPTVDRILDAVGRLRTPRSAPRKTPPDDSPPDAGRLERNSHELLGGQWERGKDCLRIDCSAGDVTQWRDLLQRSKAARPASKVSCTVLMSIGPPTLRIGPIEPAPAVLKIRPRRDVFGRVDKPARVWLTAGEAHAGAVPTGAAHAGAPAADAILTVEAKWLSGVERGQVIRFLDTRGRKRRLHVVDVKRGGAWAEMHRTAYVTQGTALCRPGSGRHSMHKTCLGGIVAAPGGIALSPGDILILSADPSPGRPAKLSGAGQVLSHATVPCDPPEALGGVAVGDPVNFDEGHCIGTAMAAFADQVHVRIERTPTRGAMLREGMALNLPHGRQDANAPPAVDSDTLQFIARNADLVSLSGIGHAQHVSSLMQRLEDASAPPPGILLHVTPADRLDDLPAALLRALRRPRFGVLLAEDHPSHDEIVRLCEAAHRPLLLTSATRLAPWSPSLLAPLQLNAGAPIRPRGGRARSREPGFMGLSHSLS